MFLLINGVVVVVGFACVHYDYSGQLALLLQNCVIKLISKAYGFVNLDGETDFINFVKSVVWKKKEANASIGH